MKTIFLFVILVFIFNPTVDAKLDKKLDLKKLKDTTSITQTFGQKKIFALDKMWDSEKYCNQQTLSNPENLEAYQINHPTYKIVTLCPGELDGEENIVSVYSLTKDSKSKKVQPLSTSSRITDKVLKAAIVELIEE